MKCTCGFLLAPLAVLCVGCGHPGAYVKNRANDFVDCFSLEAGLGIGADVEVHVTDWLATGVGASVSVKWGFLGRQPVNIASYPGGIDVHVGFPVAPVALLCVEGPFWGWPKWMDRCRFLCTHSGHRHVVPVISDFAPDDNGALFDPERQSYSIIVFNVAALTTNRGRMHEPNLVHAFNVDVGATLVPVSARVGFSFGQFADFLVGWTTLDLAGDDEAGFSLGR